MFLVMTLLTLSCTAVFPFRNG